MSPDDHFNDIIQILLIFAQIQNRVEITKELFVHISVQCISVATTKQ